MAITYSKIISTPNSTNPLELIFCSSLPSIRKPQMPTEDSPYNLFSLFWPEQLWKAIANNTNEYALLRGAQEETSAAAAKQ